MDIKTCRYVSVSQLVPSDWNDWFWDLISEDAPFSWGGNSFSLVSPLSFFALCESLMSEMLSNVSITDLRSFFNAIKGITDGVYIDLES